MDVIDNLQETPAKHSYYYLFYLLTLAELILFLFFGYWPVFFVTILASVTPGLVYHILSEKGFTVSKLFIILHFSLTLITTYLSYHIFRLFVQTMVIRNVHYSAASSLKIPIFIDCSLLIISVITFVIGLAKSNVTK